MENPTHAGKVTLTHFSEVPWLVLYSLGCYVKPPEYLDVKKNHGLIFVKRFGENDNIPCVLIEKLPEEQTELFLMKATVRAIANFGAGSACLMLKSKLSVEKSDGSISDRTIGRVFLYFEPGVKRVFFFDPETNTSKEEHLIEATKPKALMPYVSDVFEFGFPLWAVKMQTEWNVPGKTYSLESKHAD